jgi:uncharacterized protein
LKWCDFQDLLKQLGEKHSIKLLFSEQDFNIHKSKPLEKPFKKGDIIPAQAIVLGQFDNEWILSSKGRAITARGSFIANKNYKIRIIKDKHNIFYGEKV